MTHLKYLIPFFRAVCERDLGADSLCNQKKNKKTKETPTTISSTGLTRLNQIWLKSAERLWSQSTWATDHSERGNSSKDNKRCAGM